MSVGLRTAVSVLAAAALVLSWLLAHGPGGPAYLLAYAAACAPGLPVGFALFGRQHAAGWIAGALAGYAITALALWIPVQLGVAHAASFVACWLGGALLAWLATRHLQPVALLPSWSRRDSLALTLVLLVVPVLLWQPFRHIGAPDEQGARRYRAYFTADFLWHVALTAELARGEAPPRNPYLSSRPLNYYWAYFVPPAVAARAGFPISACLTINALGAGLLFVSAIFLATWSAVPRAGPAALATLAAVLAASAEGLAALWRLWERGQALERVRYLNVDAVTAWFHRGLSIDGLPRSLWYTPQHAAACALALVALQVPGRAAPRTPSAGLLAGLYLGLALIFSPFLGGSFCLIYGLTAVWIAARSRGDWLASLHTTAPAVLPVGVAFAWCVASGTFEGAGGSVAVGISRLAAAAPLLAPALALGPLLALAMPGLAFGRTFRTESAVVGIAVGFAMFYFVTLTAEPVWIGWRAGQILLVTLPALAAATLGALADRRRAAVAAAFVAVVFGVGLPTTLIDGYNAQDVGNSAMGPGFRWTVVVPADAQAALDWIRRSTPPDAVVQMSIAPRGRETWTLVPSFAERRMAAGQPISLLRIPDYERRSALADEMFRTADAQQAALLARRLRVDFVYVDRVEREAFGDAAIGKFSDARFFSEAFRQGSATVYAVR